MSGVATSVTRLLPNIVVLTLIIDQTLSFLMYLSNLVPPGWTLQYAGHFVALQAITVRLLVSEINAPIVILQHFLSPVAHHKFFAMLQPKPNNPKFLVSSCSTNIR
jgi:hypothetical protein